MVATLVYWLYAYALHVSDLNQQMERVLAADVLCGTVAVLMCGWRKYWPAFIFSSVILVLDCLLLLHFALRNANWH